jgi:hypothetical protein
MSNDFQERPDGPTLREVRLAIIAREAKESSERMSRRGDDPASHAFQLIHRLAQEIAGTPLLVVASGPIGPEGVKPGHVYSPTFGYVPISSSAEPKPGIQAGVRGTEDTKQ